MSKFGCGQWAVQVLGRGGSPLRLELAHTSISVNGVLNNSAQCSVNVPAEGGSRSNCCQAFESVEPWRDELLVWRDKDVAHVGPLTNMKAGQSGTFLSNDLFHWCEQRFLEEDFHGDGDASDVFKAIFETGMAADESPNIGIQTRDCGVSVTRDFKGSEFQKVADKLRELSRTGLDFYMDGRTLVAGGASIFTEVTPLLIHDDGVSSAEVSWEGVNLAR